MPLVINLELLSYEIKPLFSGISTIHLQNTKVTAYQNHTNIHLKISIADFKIRIPIFCAILFP